jgi:hypothetical protein
MRVHRYGCKETLVLFRLLFPFIPLFSFGATLTVAPAFNADCTLGRAIATLTWSGASGPVQIQIGQPNGIPLNAFTDPAGIAITGPWVTEGMTFYLIDQAGTVEASATAHLTCGGTPRTIDRGLSGGSYFPLAVGNTWVYKYNSRFITGDYIVRTITDTRIIGGQTYYVLTQILPIPPVAPALLRADSNGVVYQNTNGVDQVYFDPTSLQKTAYSGPLGSFTDAVQLAVQGFDYGSSIYVRGIGLVNSQSFLGGGSDGGFSSGIDLVDVRVDGVHISVPVPKIGLSIETTDLDLTNQLVPNCAIPCYYGACGIGSPYDRPGVYRPCAQARIDTSSATAGYTVLLQLLDAGGNVVFQNSLTAPIASTVDYVRVPLYTQPVLNPNYPFVLLPAGDYKLLGSIVNGGTTEATSSIAVHIR